MIDRITCYSGVLALLAVASHGTTAIAGPADVPTFGLHGGLRFRHEQVDSSAGSARDATAFTVRSNLRLDSPTWSGWSGSMEIEDVRPLFGVDEYSVPATGFNAGQHAVIADPRSSEIDQALLRHTGARHLLQLGRQVVNLGNQRHVGAVGWRQDWQTFDALRLDLAVTEALQVQYLYLDQRHGVNATATDADSDDHLLQLRWQRGGYDATFYHHALKDDAQPTATLDNYGLRLEGESMVAERAVNWVMELATQQATRAGVPHEASYLALEAGVTLPRLQLKAGLERLGSDDGRYGFSTPLATLHAFNGWADMFLATPATGLLDVYTSLHGKPGPGNLDLVVHAFTTPGGQDLGREIDVQYLWPISKAYVAGIKLAAFESSTSALPDRAKLWVWLQVSF